MTQPITIILPVYKGKEMTEQCLESIYKNTINPYNVIIIADGQYEEDYNYLLDFQDEFNLDIMIIIKKKRTGLIESNNIGMKIAKGDVLLTQNDVVFPKLEQDCWLTRLVKKSQDSKVGIVGCLNSVRQAQPIDFCGTWCMYIKRKTINEIGYFDERFSPAMMDDVDYSKRVLLHQLTIEKADFVVEHLGSATLKNMNDKQLKENSAKLYEEKWADFNDNMNKEEIKKYDYWR